MGAAIRVVMSSEHWSLITDNTQLAVFAFDLSQTTTRIVMVYRPFYDWIASYYRQIEPKPLGGSKRGKGRDWRSVGAYVDWLFPPNGSQSGSAHIREIPPMYIPFTY